MLYHSSVNLFLKIKCTISLPKEPNAHLAYLRLPNFMGAGEGGGGGGVVLCTGAGVLTYFAGAGAGAGVCSPPAKLRQLFNLCCKLLSYSTLAKKL